MRQYIEKKPSEYKLFEGGYGRGAMEDGQRYAGSCTCAPGMRTSRMFAMLQSHERDRGNQRGSSQAGSMYDELEGNVHK